MRCGAVCVTVVGLVASMGCATLVNGRTQAVTIYTEPSSAQVFVEGVQETTPATIRLSRTAPHTLMFVREGATPIEFELGRQVSWAMWLDVVPVWLAYVLLPFDLHYSGAFHFESPVVVDLATQTYGPGCMSVRTCRVMHPIKKQS